MRTASDTSSKPEHRPSGRPSHGRPAPARRGLARRFPSLLSLALPAGQALAVPGPSDAVRPGFAGSASSIRLSLGMPQPDGPAVAEPVADARAAVQAWFARQIEAAYRNASWHSLSSLDGASAAHLATALVSAAERDSCAVQRSLDGLAPQVETLLGFFQRWSTGAVPAGDVGDQCASERGLTELLGSSLAELSATSGEPPASFLATPASAAPALRRAFGSPERFLELRLERIRLLRSLFALLGNPLVAQILIPLLWEKASSAAGLSADPSLRELRDRAEAYADTVSSFGLSLLDEYERVLWEESLLSAAPEGEEGAPAPKLPRRSRAASNAPLPLAGGSAPLPRPRRTFTAPG